MDYREKEGDLQVKGKRQVEICIVLLILIGIFSGCQSGMGKEEKETKKVDYRIGVVADNAPYYEKESDGTEKGYYVDFLNTLAKEESFTYVFVPVDMISYEQSLLNKTIDAFIGTGMIDSDKENRITEGRAFYTSDICMLSPIAQKINTLKEIENKQISVPCGTKEEIYAEYLANKYKAQSIAFANIAESIKDTQIGYSQICILDREYYENHAGIFGDWQCIKVSHHFQNIHRFYTGSNGKLKKLSQDNNLAAVFAKK